jgi:type II secretory pathway component GspD/PulD (secretin)
MTTIKKQFIFSLIFLSLMGSLSFYTDSLAQVLTQEPPAPVPVKKAPASIEDIDEKLMVDTLELKAMDITDVLKLLSQKSGLNIVVGSGVQGKVTIYLKDVRLKDTLYIILDANDLAYKVEDGIVRVMPAKEFEQRYGYTFGGKIQTRILHVSHIEVPDAVAVVTQMKSPAGKIIFDVKSGTIVLMDTPDKLKDMEELLKEIDIPIAVEVFELNYAKAKDIAPKVAEMLTKGMGSMRFDETTNKIIVKDSPLRIKEIQKIISAFDTKRREVLIEAKIVQIVLNNEHKFGVDWEAIVNDYHKLRLVSNFDVLDNLSKKGELSIGTLEKDNYSALVEALETVGDTNILSSPRITALNNEEAKILVGSTEPYVTTTTTTPAAGPTTTAESVNFIDVGVKLYVTPTIHQDDFITMKIKPEVSSVTHSLTTSQNNQIPVVETSQAETVVMVKDATTIVIGGLIKEEKISSVNRVPLLGSIPVIGFAFRNTSNQVKKTEIVIFLTPKIVSGDFDMQKNGEPVAADLSYSQ